MNHPILSMSIHEINKKLNGSVKSYQSVENVAQQILSTNIKSVLIHGCCFGHDQFCHDYWTNGSEAFWLSHHHFKESHSDQFSLILDYLGSGYEIKEAIIIAKMQEFLPYLSDRPLLTEPEKFVSCKSEELGLYPIVDSSKWVAQLLSIGVKTLQLRIKNKNRNELEHEIQRSIELANTYSAKLFVNDYWELAICHKAYGVHLGQEDLNSADIKKIRDAGLHLGVSTHCYYEVARAHTIRPSYLACGPIFPTTSKIMCFAPQGIEQLKQWKKILNYPLVAIGGINEDNLEDVLSTKVDGIAMISAISQSKNPLETTKVFLEKIALSRNLEERAAF